MVSGMPGASGYGGDMYGSGYGSGMAGGSGMPGMAMSGGYPGQPVAPPPWKPDERDFVNVAHSLWAIVLATAGGWIALVIYSTGQRKDAAYDERAKQ
jgi:hypothetical protein